MAHLSNIFTRRKVDIPNRSGFDLSFENLLTMKVGTLTPVVCEEVIPNETYTLGYRGVVQMPPMATNFFGRVDLRLEAFFVPMRILWGGWQNFWTMPANNPYGSPVIRPTSVPSFSGVVSSLDEFSENFGPGSLADYLGLKLNTPTNLPASQIVNIPNILPWVAYHKIWDDWYRNSRIQKPAFVNSPSLISGGLVRVLPWLSQTYRYSTFDNFTDFADGVSLFSLRQRCWAKDYFTSASLYPQANGSETLGTEVKFDTSGDSGSFTIGALRSANVLQRWYERNNIAGERYGDQIKAQYGILPSDAFLDRPLFLGSSKVGIYSNSVSATAESSASDSNPFAGSLGAKGGQAQSLGEDSLIDNFRSTEHGYIMVLASIVPHAYYGTGIRRQLQHSVPGDFPIPLLQGIGEQGIYLSELSGSYLALVSDNSFFGYTVENAENKYHDDEVHGLLRAGESLDAFVLQRSFDKPEKLVLGSDFVEIPTTAMDNVTAVTSALSQYGAWADFAFQFKKVSPLSEYVIPTLGDLRNTHKESIPVGGRQL